MQICVLIIFTMKNIVWPYSTTNMSIYDQSKQFITENEEIMYCQYTETAVRGEPCSSTRHIILNRANQLLFLLINPARLA